MSTPARRHRERVSALVAHQAARAALAPLENAKPYELMRARLDADMRRLKLIQSIERKVELKRQLLPEYAAWVDGVLEANSGQQDEVLVTAMVWRIDTGDISGALRIADYALWHDLKLPARYERTLPCLLAEEIADAAKRQLDEKKLPELDPLLETDRLTAAKDMPDEVRSKLQKVIGLTLVQRKRTAKGLEYLRRALALNTNAGVRKDIERAERALKNTDEGTHEAPS